VASEVEVDGADVEDDASAEVEANRCRRACVLKGCTMAVARLAVNDILLEIVAVGTSQRWS
jgi:endonuclease V-like protein UPF0215 family